MWSFPEIFGSRDLDFWISRQILPTRPDFQGDPTNFYFTGGQGGGQGSSSSPADLGVVTSSVQVSFVGAGFVVVATIFLDLVTSLLTSCLATVVGWQTGLILSLNITTHAKNQDYSLEIKD